MSEDKEYVGTMKLGEVTDTQDRDGEILESHEVGVLDRAAISAAFAKFHVTLPNSPHGLRHQEGTVFLSTNWPAKAR